MRDYLGNELNIGDECVYFQNKRTGSSTIRKCKFKGHIIGFTRKLIVVRCFAGEFESKVGSETKVHPDDVIKIVAPAVHGRWVHISEKSDVYYDTYKCSNCHEEVVIDQGLKMPKFCHECGARMDGGAGE